MRSDENFHFASQQFDLFLKHEISAFRVSEFLIDVEDLFRGIKHLLIGLLLGEFSRFTEKRGGLLYKPERLSDGFIKLLFRYPKNLLFSYAPVIQKFVDILFQRGRVRCLDAARGSQLVSRPRLKVAPTFLRLLGPADFIAVFRALLEGRPVACLAWSSAPRHLGSRDRYIGWGAEARRRNIRFLAYNTRFLILPWVRVEHLASHILGRMAARISEDWQRMYGHPVYFLETFVDPERFRGTCYRAANWVFLGKTTGRGKQSNSYVPNRSIKEVLGYPLIKRFRELLGEVG